MKIERLFNQLGLEQSKCLLLGYKIVEAILMLIITWLISLCYK